MVMSSSVIPTSAAQEDAVDLIRVQLVDLLADQLVAEIDDA